MNPLATLKPGNERQPALGTLVPRAYRPPDSFEHHISDGENWRSLAERYRIDVNKLIHDNFKTLEPAEVNWYLREYVNCDTPTLDQYNWRFSTSARRGPSPRAGIIYVVPNWESIGIGAKKATRRWVVDWFGSCELTRAEVKDSTLTIEGLSVVSHAQGAPPFKLDLVLAGAPDQLIDPWTDCLQNVLRVFTIRIHGAFRDVFPPVVSPYPRTRVGPIPCGPFSLLKDLHEESIRAGQFGEILPRSRLTGVAARVSLANYARWFERSFWAFRAKAVAVGVWAQGVSGSDGSLALGRAWGGMGFLNNLSMDD
jgi:hypothetical protein